MLTYRQTAWTIDTRTAMQYIVFNNVCLVNSVVGFV